MSAVLDWTMLHAHFEKRLIERNTIMHETLDELTKASDGGHLRSELERQFHSLAGIAGTYGYPDITDIARRGELLVQHASVTELRQIVESLSTD